ncbi:esterase family protein [Nocardia sp. CDC159]|uniref:Esterase family protein n=1 Tax=Nocardia pulmonis TaxID=2951408 RepID=A0A9X2E789_9NOCA|nr:MULTISPECIES: alpha/beta hydrolase family protein [Nocardia]MCM6772936.1 esterase family protein [Nocardia pulmonis]MCM6785761.1 esterase family protein [Nocardia sp. CDC159]
MRVRAVAVVVLAVTLGVGAPLSGPVPGASAARIVRIDDLGPRRSAVLIDSPAMDRAVQVQVLHPPGGGARPTYYLLDGLDPGTGQSTWTNATDAENFFAGKNVNVVLPLGGQASYYTDWQRDDPRFGRYRWETFLTRELPPIIDAAFAGNGVNAIGGLSMGGIAAFVLAARHPGRYRAVAGYSACPDLGLAQGAMLFSIANRGGDPANMWGPPGSPAWAEHDPALLADRLRGKTIYLSTGTGIPGPHEAEIKPQLPENIFFGGPIEAGVDACVTAFEQRLRGMDIPARVDHSPVGTHSWSYWQDTLHGSWSSLAPALGA